MLISILVCAIMLTADPEPPAATSPEDSARQFAFRLAGFLNERDGAKLSAAFDTKEMTDRILDVEGADPIVRVGFEPGFRDNFRLGEVYCAQMESDAWSEPLRVTKNDEGGYKALLRVVQKGSLFYYLEFRIIQKGDDWAIVDLLSSGTPQTQCERTQSALLSRLELGFPKNTLDRSKAESSVSKLSKEGKFEEALARLEQVEAEWGSSPFMRWQRVLVLGGLARWEEMQSVADAALQKDPDQVAIAMTAYDYLQGAKKYKEALRYLDPLDRWAGEDPYVEFVRGLFFVVLGEKERAVEFLEKSIAEDRYLPGPYLQLVNLGVELERWELVGKTLHGCEEYLEWDLSSLADSEAFQGFFGSEVGKKWQAEWKLRQAEKAREQSEADEASDELDDE